MFFISMQDFCIYKEKLAQYTRVRYISAGFSRPASPGLIGRANLLYKCCMTFKHLRQNVSDRLRHTGGNILEQQIYIKIMPKSL